MEIVSFNISLKIVLTSSNVIVKMVMCKKNMFSDLLQISN
jgi:hypothetical protein